MATRRILTLVVGLTVGLTVGTASLTGTGVAAPAPEPKPAVNGNFPVDGEPQRIVAGPDGNVWFNVAGNSGGNELAKISPAGAITYFDVPGITGLGWLTIGPDKNIWATINTGVIRISPANPTGAESFNITGFNDPQGITTGPDGNLWAAGGDKLYRVPLADPTTATPFPIAGMASRAVTATKDRVWVADATGKVHAVTVSGTVTTINTGGMTQGIVAGRDGQVFFTVPDGADTYVGRLTLGGSIQKTPFPNTDPSFGPGFGPDGNYWFGLLVSREALAVSSAGAVTKAGTFAAPYGARYATAGPNATMWFALQDPGNDGAIGRVSGLVQDKKARIKVKGSTAAVANGKARVRLKCPKAEANGPCTGKVVLRSLRGATLGSRKYSIKAGKTRTVKVGLAPGTIRQIGRNGLRVQATVKVKDALGNKKTVRRQIRLVD